MSECKTIHVAFRSATACLVIAFPAFLASPAGAQPATSGTIASPPAAPPAAAPTPAAGSEADSASTQDVTPYTPPPPPRHRFGLSLGLEAGITYWTETSPFGTDTAIGRALAPGYNLGVRASFELLPWLAIDARGMTTHNPGNDLVNGGTLQTVGALGAVRITAPIKHIQPYLLAGYGAHRVSASGDGTQLVSGTFSALEFGLGLLVPTSDNFEFGFEYLYSHLNSETISTNENADGGDPSTMSLFGQYHFDL